MGNCMSCGGSAKRKMATGGSTTNKLNKPKAPVKPQTGGSNTKMGIYGIPSAGPTGNNLSGTYSYKKGGATTAVKASCKKGMVRSATGGCVAERPKFAKGGSSFGMLSVKAGVDKNPRPTAADRIAGAKMKKGTSTKKYQKGGSTFVPTPKPKMTVNTNPVKKSKYTTAPRKIPMAQNGGATKPKPKYVYGDAPGIGGPAAGQAATPGETILMDQKLAAQRKAKAAAAKRKAQTTKKGK
jgi:hypothetical protein